MANPNAPKKDVMKVWRDLVPKAFFMIDGEVFQKNSATTALHVTNPVMGELYIGPAQAMAIKPYMPVTPKATPENPTPAPVLPVAPKDPEIFETKLVERPPYDPNFGATKITVTPADSKIEAGIQPPKGWSKHSKKAKSEPKPEPEVKPTEENQNG
jgi:hypothetical protein